MPTFLRWVSYAMPTTISSYSLRSILDKGYPFADPQVYSGFLVTVGWTIFFILCCFFGLRNKVV